MASTTLYAAIEATVRDFMASYEEASRLANPALLSRACAPDCVRQIAPASFLRSFGRDPDALLSNADYESYMTTELQLMDSMRSDIFELSIDVSALRAAARVAHHVKLRGRESVPSEICWFFNFSSDGEKITKIVEFLDTAETLKYVERMKEVAAELGLNMGK